MIEDKSLPPASEMVMRAAKSLLTPPVVFEALVSSGDIRVLRAVAGNMAAPRSILFALSKHADFMVCGALAGNSSTPPAALDALYARTLVKAEPDKNRVAYEAWLWRMASNPATPDHILSILARDIDPRIRLSVARNPGTPMAIVNFLTGDDVAPIRNAAAAVIAAMSGEHEENDRKEPASHHSRGIPSHYAGVYHLPLSPTEFAELATDNDPMVRETVATRPDAPPDILGLLCLDKSINVVRAVAKNPSTPEHLLDLLSYCDDETVRLFVAIHQSTSRFTLARLISDQSPGVSTAAKTHTNTPWRQAPCAPRLKEAENNTPRGP